MRPDPTIVLDWGEHQVPQLQLKGESMRKIRGRPGSDLPEPRGASTLQ